MKFPKSRSLYSTTLKKHSNAFYDSIFVQCMTPKIATLSINRHKYSRMYQSYGIKIGTLRGLKPIGQLLERTTTHRLRNPYKSWSSCRQNYTKLGSFDKFVKQQKISTRKILSNLELD